MTVEFSVHGHRVVFELPDPTDLIQRKIRDSKMFYEIDLLENMRARVNAGGLCVDVGAHLGNHTIFLAKVCGMRVLAFEPQPDIYRLLVEHVRLNGVQDRVQTFNMALGEIAARGTMTRPLTDNTGGATLTLDSGGSVEVSTLDAQIGDRTIDLVKIDVEGFELEVLKGGRRAIARDKPIIYAEAIDSQARKTLDVYLSPRGYVAGEAFCSTPVVAFEHCDDDLERLAVLTGRIESAHEELERNVRHHVSEHSRTLRQRISSLASSTDSIDRRLDGVEQRLVSATRHSDERLSELSASSERHAALLYELWNLGVQVHDHMPGPGADAARTSATYQPLNVRAADLVDWVPQRKRWTIPKGTEAGAFLQGYTSKVSARPGDSVYFHLSTNRVPMFVKVRVFGFGDRSHVRLTELDVSPPLAVPKTGVWGSGSPDHVDERTWRQVYKLSLGRSWRPGCYVARFEDVDGAAVLHPFWVTSRKPESRTLRLCPTITHYMRNGWQASAGSSLGRLFRSQSSAVRFPRPFGGSRGGKVLRNELPLFRWASANAVAMDCLTDMQVHSNPALLDDYDHIVIAGDCRYLTRELLAALTAFKSRGASITVLGAVPGEREVTLDVEAGTLTKVSGGRDAWTSANAALWGACHHWTHKGPPLDLRFTDQAAATVLADSEFRLPVVGDKLCDGRASGTDLAPTDSRLVARATAGSKHCDTTFEITAEGARLFIAGTDRWTTVIDDLFDSKGIRAEIDFVTARIVGASADRAAQEALVSVIMTTFDSAGFVSRAIESILAQSYQRLELVIVDDNSTDSTFDVLLDFAARDPRVRPFKSFRNNGTYWSKNFGITQARGELITFQDSDDTSAPDRLVQQVQALRWNPAAIASMVDYERRNEHGELLLNRGVSQRRCFPSIMFRAAEVLPAVGFFDSVRTSADQEHLHRLRLVFGADRIVDIRKPLYQALVRKGSLTTSDGAEVKLDADARTHLSESRQRYVEAFKRWHERIEHDSVSPYIAFPLIERTFAAPDRIGIASGRTQAAPARADAERVIESYRQRTVVDSEGTRLGFSIDPLPDDPENWHRIVGLERPERLNRADARDFDVIMMSDFRFPGGTSQSNAAEIDVQIRNGISTGLVQVASPVLKRDHPINPVIQRLVDRGGARLLSPGEAASCKLLVIRHPTVLERPIDELPSIRADAVVVIVNQAPSDENTGRVFYDMASCQAKAKQRFGSAGTWFPIGPLVRKTVAELPGNQHLSPNDWENIIDIDEWPEPASRFVGDVPVIGRHSRDTPDKWPPDRKTLLAAYPTSGVKVRVLGGAAPVKETLGAFPDNWEVLEFGAETPQDFLRTIDFLVYFHHPSLVEAFGRTILEALAAGVPAIIPHHFSELFEDVAIYAEPDEVLGIVLELYADRARYEQRSRAGIELARRRFSYAAHVDRLRRLIPDLGSPLLPSPSSPSPSPRSALAADTAYLEPDSVYKFGFELSGVEPSSRGRLRGVSRDTEQEVFVIPVDGTRSAMSEFVVNAEGRARIDVVVEVDEGAPFSIAKMRARRRADRPKQPTLALSDTSITAALATYPGRRAIAPDVIDALAPQVDKLFVYLNNYDDVPAFIRNSAHRDRIVFILDPASQLRAAAKFHWLESVRGYHLVCDDDIIYPPDYAKRMVAAIDRYDRKAILGVHGVIFEPELVDARTSRRSVFKFPDELGDDTPVHFLGTGTVALHTSVLAHMDLSEFAAFPIANDEILAVSAKAAGVPMVCVNRGAQWLTPHADVEFGIFEERQIDGGEHDKATELLVRANPWPELGIPGR